MKHRQKVKKGILSLVFALALAASLSMGIGVGEVRAEDVTGVTTWQELKKAISKGGAIRLDADVTAGETDYEILVESTNVVLDLNGHIIDRHLTQASYSGRVFNLYDNANLTIQDNSVGQTGKITGAWNQSDNGGCIQVQSGCTLNLEGGSIEGNKNDASISRAGGVYNSGTFNMTGGRITGNTAGYGAGVLVLPSGTFNMTGGEIAGNVSSGGSVDKGAGVYAYNGACVTLGGEARITGNTGSNGAASNLYIGVYYNSYAINLSSTVLTGKAQIGISTEATDTVAITTAGKDSAPFFTADDSAGYEISTNSSDSCIYLAKKNTSFISTAFINSTDPENNVCGAALSGTINQLMEQLLTADEKAAIEAGTLTVEVALTVDGNVSDADKGVIEAEAAKGNAQIGKYLNVTLMLKKTGSNEWTPIQNTDSPVTITLQVPGELINSNGSVTRTYQIIRLHSGVITVLPCNYDSATGTVSFQTDRFSSYAIAYIDTPNGSSGAGESGSGESGNGESGNGESGNGGSGNGEPGNGGSGSGESGNGGSEGGDSGDDGSDAASTTQLDAVPKTGDSDKAAIFLALGLLSGMGAAILWKGSYGKENSHCE